MNEKLQLKACAELDGLIGEWQIGENENHILINGRWVKAPNYFTYDGIIPLIQKQDSQTKHHFIATLVTTQLVSGQYQWDATPSQLLESLLRSVGKWETS